MERIVQIFVNQIGYPKNKTKFAYATGLNGGETLEIKKVAQGESGPALFTIKAASPLEDRVAGEPVCALDFSDFEQDGDFYIVVKTPEGSQVRSVPFRIGDNLYNDVFTATVKYFYLSRCGQKITESDGGPWAHEACHNTPAVVYGTDKKIEVNGGWHDAGDYGRYIVAASKAVMDLLLAYEQCGGAGTDLLGEVRFELEWMLKMQREDGGVYHKVSCYHFCGVINPDEEKDELVVSPVSSTATADFAGCCAFASIFFEEGDPAFAKKLMDVALKAWKYLESHDEEPFKNPPEITTGGYGDWSSADERYFACASLFMKTGDSRYLNKALELRKSIETLPADPDFPWKNKWIEGFGWGMVAGYGTEIFLRAKDKITDKNTVKLFEDSIIGGADRLLERIKNASFGTGLDRVHWGSNGHVCDQAHLLLAAWDITHDKAYYEAAKKQLDYVLGCNPMNVCYVTGFGVNTVKCPHHRPSGAAKKTMPGMLSGGPCEGLYDACAKEKLGPLNLPPLRCFIDDFASYSTNEIAIYWNSSFVYIASKLKMV